jgi:hypothetical protein
MLFILRSFSTVLLLSGLMVAAPSPGLADDANPAALVGHWRKTTIQHLGPRDEHLALSEDGTMRIGSSPRNLGRSQCRGRGGSTEIS